MELRLGAADLVEREVRAFRAGGRYIVVVKLDGALHALNDACQHSGVLLSGGHLEGSQLVCPGHGYTFDVRTGRNTTRPRLCDDQPVLPLRVEGGEMIVDLPGDAARERKHHHPHGSKTGVKVLVVTCSDSRTQDTDDSGRLAEHLLREAGHVPAGRLVVPDDPAHIVEAVRDRAAALGVDAVLVNGGTGISRRDSTFEALCGVFEKRLDGFGELFRMLSYQDIGPAAMLSRAAAGLVGGRLVFSVPDSPAAVRLALEKLILPELGHAVNELTR
jgi:molybdenum cofactor biosynthesis protein B